jgi:hypothetical protein
VSLAETLCRDQAHSVLKQFMVGAPNEIDLDTIAWHIGRLRVEIGQLDTAEGRLIAGGDGGFIRVREGVRPLGRQRFVVAHELGHFCLHKAESALDTFAQLTDWRIGSREMEANTFAAELLMPQFLFAPRIQKQIPSLSGIDALAEEFITSNLATAMQFINYTREPCALVVIKNGTIAWRRKNTAFEFWIRDDVHPYSAAGEILAGKSGDTGKMVSVPASAWLTQFEGDAEAEIKEDSRELRGYDTIVSMLWIDDVI